MVTEDGFAKVLDLTDDIPRLIVRDIFHDVFQQPLQDYVCGMKVFNQMVDGEFFYLSVIEFDAQVGGQIEFSCQVTKHRLKKSIDGLHAEIIIVVE